jgi:hypothetical protein
MTTYRVTGFDPLSPREASEAFRLTLGQADGFDERVCLTAHADDLEGIRAVAGVDLPEVSLFGWKELLPGEVEDLEILPSLRSAQVLCGDFRVAAREHWELPFYDWPETRTTLGMVTLQHQVPKQSGPLSAQMEPEPPCVEALTAALATNLKRPDLDVKHSSTVLNDQVTHIYNVRVPLGQLVGGFGAALSLLPPGKAAAGFELTVPADRATQVPGGGVLAGPPFPEGLCLSPFRTAFALAPDGVSFPIPNLSSGQAAQAFERGWERRKGLKFLGLKRSFLAWRARDGQRAARTMGNFCLLHIEKQTCALEIGVEQFGDKDVPVRLVKNELERVLQFHGLQLNRA